MGKLTPKRHSQKLNINLYLWKMKTRKTHMLENSLTQQFLPADYMDVFACDLDGAGELTADEILIGFFTVMPGWVNALFKLRDVLVRPFGLKTGTDEGRVDDFKSMILNGGEVGLASQVAKSECETVLLLSDKHLNAYISIMVTQDTSCQKVKAITLVHYHNSLGRAYFFFIKPFHKMVVKSMLNNTIRRLL